MHATFLFHICVLWAVFKCPKQIVRFPSLCPSTYTSHNYIICYTLLISIHKMSFNMLLWLHTRMNMNYVWGSRSIRLHITFLFAKFCIWAYNMYILIRPLSLVISFVVVFRKGCFRGFPPPTVQPIDSRS